MADKELQKQIDDLTLVVGLEEENYKTAIQQQISTELLSQMRAHIKELKNELQVLLDKQSVERTGELPEGGVS